MSDQIFIIDGEENTLTPAPMTPPAREDRFQAMIEEHPELLAGAHINPEDPLRWLLVRREMSVPDTDSGTNRWSLDHLFVDHLGIPTLVEIKRAADTRIRREVVGQMLDYAANAQIHWDIGDIRELVAQTHGDKLGERMRELLGVEFEGDHEEEAATIDRFWDTVAARIERGHMRLLFVADHIPSELKRIIEFLNTQMEHVEVLGVELTHYRAGSTEILVPRLVGQSEVTRTRRKRASGARPATTKAAALEQCRAEVSSFYEELHDAAGAAGATIYWGNRGFSATFAGSFKLYVFPPRGESGAYVEFYFDKANYEAARIAELRQALIDEDDAYRLAGNYSVKCYLVDDAAIDAAARGWEKITASEGISGGRGAPLASKM